MALPCYLSWSGVGYRLKPVEFSIFSPQNITKIHWVWQLNLSVANWLFENAEFSAGNTAINLRRKMAEIRHDANDCYLWSSQYLRGRSTSWLDSFECNRIELTVGERLSLIAAPVDINRTTITIEKRKIYYYINMFARLACFISIIFFSHIFFVFCLSIFFSLVVRRMSVTRHPALKPITCGYSLSSNYNFLIIEISLRTWLRIVPTRLSVDSTAVINHLRWKVLKINGFNQWITVVIGLRLIYSRFRPQGKRRFA